MPYQDAWNLQQKLAGEIAEGRLSAAFILLEHPHVFTAGRSTGEGHLLWDETERKSRGVELFEVDRGGDITYHGPGQLVGYPLFKLDPLRDIENASRGADTVGFVRKIEKAMIQSLAKFGLAGLQRPGFTGVWVNRGTNRQEPDTGALKKIASIGVKVDVNRITRHGFALNVDPDMNYWNGIVACGIPGAVMTSMAECMAKTPDMDEVIRSVLESFEDVFGYKIILDYQI